MSKSSQFGLFGLCVTLSLVLSPNSLSSAFQNVSPPNNAFAKHGTSGENSLRDENWIAVGNDRGGMRFSPLDQINRTNVAKLKLAWTYRTGEGTKTCECTPLVIDGRMYITTNRLRAVALDAATGKEIWSFNPFDEGVLKLSKQKWPLASGGVNRGLAFWTDGKPEGERRILHGTSDGRLFSIDAKTGKLDPAFGNQGVKSLREDLKRDLSRMPYGPTSAPAIYKDIVIVGFSCGEGPGPAAPGDIRAFDVRTGKQVWRFHTVPQKGDFGNETWEGDSWKNRGAANAWGGFSVDTKRGLVFAGLGSASFDFYGGDRKGKNLFANCTICLDAKTGKRVWHFQTLHHDLWDHDLPTYPNLITVEKDGQKIDAAAQVTKTGYVFLFDRETGKPLFEVKETPVEASTAKGEKAWPTQPIPVKPPPFAKTRFDESDITDISEASRKFVLEKFSNLKTGPSFHPPSEQGTICIPGFHGGATWSGASYDPKQGLLFVSSNNVPNVITLKPVEGLPYPFGITGYHRFLDQDGYPAIKPPWGVLTALDLNRGEIRWQVVLGEHKKLTKRGVPATGTENFGGTIATAGGLVFIGGTKDEKFRAFDSSTGKVLWETQLPAGGYATPSTYSVNGKQYVVIAACGGGKPGTKPADFFMAFSLQK